MIRAEISGVFLPRRMGSQPVQKIRFRHDFMNPILDGLGARPT